jgi:hypothetical protein
LGLGRASGSGRSGSSAEDLSSRFPSCSVSFVVSLPPLPPNDADPGQAPPDGFHHEEHQGTRRREPEPGVQTRLSAMHSRANCPKMVRFSGPFTHDERETNRLASGGGWGKSVRRLNFRLFGLKKSLPDPPMGDENLGSVLVVAIAHVLRALFGQGTDTGPASWTARLGGWMIERGSFGRFTYDRNRALIAKVFAAAVR